MNFSSLQIGKTNGINVKTPFLDEKFSTYAKSINISNKIGEYNGHQWGKFILRKCFESESRQRNSMETKICTRARSRNLKDKKLFFK